MSLPVCRHHRRPSPAVTARSAVVLAIACLGTAFVLRPAHAQDTAEPQTVTVGATRALATAEAPYAVSRVDAEALRAAGPMVNLSEALGAVPGLVVANRNNYAQDLQISARGFGARAGFGVRGLRLYADGIPASGPDGQGQVAHFDLAGAAQVEVLRGPFSALYGNSSGGVIALVSAPVREGRVEIAADDGGAGLEQGRFSLAAPLPGGAALQGSFTKMRQDGFRPQSAANRQLAQWRLTAGEGTQRITISASDHVQHAQDPLGLRRAQFDADPYQTTSEALRFNTRKDIAQTQAGLRWQWRPEQGALRELALALYDGSRDVTQWLAIEPGTQANPRHGGGVVDFSRGYRGGDLRFTFAWGAADFVAGLAVDRQVDERRGFENFIGTGAAQQLGVTGTPRRDETNRATSEDLYAQVTWPLTADPEAWQLSAGLRSGRLRMTAEDRYLANGNDSGRLEFDYANPVLGLRWRPLRTLTLHASLARGYESPTLGELAYRPDNSAGFNDALRAQRSTQFEVGAKWRATGLELDAVLFAVDTRDEIGVQSSAGGRATFQNVGRTRRHGAELAAGAVLPAGFRAQAALTWLQAEYRDGFRTCTALPCATPNVAIPAGNRIAGTQRGTAFARVEAPPVSWLPGRVALEWRAAAPLAANDLNTEAAPGYALLALRWLHRIALGEGQQLELLARIDNLADKRYAGSVIVNDTSSRFYETGAPRSALVSARWQQRF